MKPKFATRIAAMTFSPSQQKRPQMAYCTTREAAALLGVSLRTAQLWVENGVLEAWKTEGGHRRISRDSIDKLLRNQPGEWAEKEAQPNGFTILIAEDEPDLLRVYTLNMARWPMRPQLLTASNGFQALVLLGSEKPDMLVADLHMPGMDGFRMLRTLHEMPEAAHTEIVVVTGLDAAEIAARGGIPGNIPILPKPIPFAELLRVATGIYDRKMATMAAEEE
jgi:excisionase family DNA binding protein